MNRIRKIKSANVSRLVEAPEATNKRLLIGSYLSAHIMGMGGVMSGECVSVPVMGLKELHHCEAYLAC